MISKHHFKPEKCIDCDCCNMEEMRCYPRDPDCEEVYDLTEEDLNTPARCDFFISKSN